MKTILLALLLALAGLDLLAQTPPPGMPALPAVRRLPRNTNGPALAPRFPSLANSPSAPGAPNAAATSAALAQATSALLAVQPEETIPAGTINFQGVDVSQVLEVYSQLVGRTLLRANLPDAKIVLKTQTPLTKVEAIQALQAVLALNGISLVNIGDKFVKVLSSAEAGTAGGEVDHSGSTNLPNLGTYVTHIAQLQFVKPSEMIPVIQPFSKLANSILAIDSNRILVLRDYAENVKRMLEMIEQIDVNVPAEYISEVIPIRYAKVDDIASALNSLSGSGGATVSIGSSAAPSPISGLPSSRSMSGVGGTGGGYGGTGSSYGSGMNSMGGIGSGASGYNGSGSSAFGNRSLGTTTGGSTANGTPTTGSTFASRLNNIINRVAGGTGSGTGSGTQDQIVLFGQTKIIPNLSSSTLLIYATRTDMEVIKGIIAKLDVPLAQVLIEALIIDYTLGNTFSLGVSAAQNPKTLWNQNNSTNIVNTVAGAGGMNNGQSFFNFANQTLGTNASSSSFGNGLGNGFSYFGNIGPTWDVAVNAAQSDSHASIIQRPRIQTSQAIPAQFFVGSSVPYITGSYSYNGVQNSYSQLSVGVELDVTPFINPAGEVTMQINQEIDEVADKNYNNSGQPSTIKRTLNTTITVRDKDTVMLGGFIKSDKNNSESGVPFLSDIPLLGNLFKQRNDSKDRQELIVLMRPTVLGTPELAAKQTIKEKQRLPGVSQVVAEESAEERKLIEAQRKREQKEFKKTKQYDGFFNTPPDEDATTNAVPVANPPTNAPAQTAPATNTPTASQLNTLTDRYMANQITAAEYMAAREKILSPAQKQKLDAQLKLYETGKISATEYVAARQKILTAN